MSWLVTAALKRWPSSMKEKLAKWRCRCVDLCSCCSCVVVGPWFRPNARVVCVNGWNKGEETPSEEEISPSETRIAPSEARLRSFVGFPPSALAVWGHLCRRVWIEDRRQVDLGCQNILVRAIEVSPCALVLSVGGVELPECSHVVGLWMVKYVMGRLVVLSLVVVRPAVQK